MPRDRIARAAKRFGIEQVRAKARSTQAPDAGHPAPGSTAVWRSACATQMPRSARCPPLLATDAGDDGPVWIQIARCGTHGHPAGSFALNPSVFADICRNFADVDRGQVAFDFEHARDGAHRRHHPQVGAPAQGWIRQLDNRGLLGLWALVSG